MVTRATYNEFRAALLEKLIGESAEQMQYIKAGIRHSLGDMDYLRRYLNWHDVMVLTETNKYKQYDVELLKEKTIYINCDAENAQVVRFWNVFKELNYEDTKAYFHFVSGRSRVGDVKHRYHADHRIRIDSSLPDGDAPKSKPSAFELILAGNYESDDQLKAKLLEAISKGCGLEPDRD